MAFEPEELVRRSGVKVEVAPDDGGEPGTYVEIVPQGSVSITDSRGTYTVADFSTAANKFDPQFTNGRTGSIGFSALLVPSDAAYLAAYGMYDNDSKGYMRITFEDEQDTPASIVRRFKGRFNQWNETGNQDNVATAAVNFLVSGKYTDPTP